VVTNATPSAPPYLGAIPVQKTAALRPALPALAFGLLLLSVIAVFGVCGNLLHMVGINYLTSGGNALQKIHPGSYAAVLAVGFVLLTSGPQRLAMLLRDHMAVAVYIGASFLLLAYVVVIIKLPAATIVDGWICAGLLAASICWSSEKQRRLLQIVIHLLLAANSAVGLLEFVQQRALIPIVFNDYTAGGAAIDITYWRFERSQGLMGHPLLASLAAGMLAVAMFSQIAFDRGASRLRRTHRNRGDAGLVRANRARSIGHVPARQRRAISDVVRPYCGCDLGPRRDLVHRQSGRVRCASRAHARR
jgi:hypothetical protein